MIWRPHFIRIITSIIRYQQRVKIVKIVKIAAVRPNERTAARKSTFHRRENTVGQMITS